MALTEAEKQELALLNQPKGLTKEEQEELRLLQANQGKLNVAEIGGLFSLVGRAKEDIVGGEVAKGVARIGRAIDPIIGVPPREALAAAVPVAQKISTGIPIEEQRRAPFVPEIPVERGKPTPKELVSPLTAFVRGIGKPTEEAATGREIAEAAGIPPEAAGVAGFGIDVLADVTNIIPLGAIAKGIAKTAWKGAKMATGGSAAILDLGTLAWPGRGLATKTVQTAKGIGEDFGSYFNKIFNPKVAPDAEDMFNVARKNNIDPNILPEAVEFGKESVIARAARKRGESILGEKYLKQHRNVTEQINKALENRITRIADGRVLTPSEAGIALREGLDNAATRVFEGADTTYRTALAEIGPAATVPNEALTKLDSVLGQVEKEARRVTELGITPGRVTPAKQVLNAVERIKASGGSYENLLAQMQEIGEVAFKNKHIVGQIPPDVKSLRKLYFAISDSLINTAEGAIPGLGTKLKNSNTILSEFFTDKSLIAKAANQKIAPEKLFQSLVQNGDTLQIQALKNILSPEDFNKMKAAFMDSLMRRNVDDFISFKMLNNTLNRKKDVVRILFSPQEITDIKEIIRLGDRIDIPVLSTSGTGASNVFDFTKENIVKALSNKATIDILKKRARAAGIAEETVNKSLEKGTFGINELIKKLGGLKRGKKELIGIKIPQVTAVQVEEQRRRK